MTDVASKYTWLVRDDAGRWLTMAGNFEESPPKSAIITGEAAWRLLGDYPDIVVCRFDRKSHTPPPAAIQYHPAHPAVH